MSEPLFLAFEKLGMLAPTPAPSTDSRLGEAAAFFLLERGHTAKARGARVLGEVTGYGTSFVAPEARRR